MVRFIMVSGKMESLKEREQRFGQMVVNMKANGIKVNL